jgi:hypothetical protein
MAYGEYTYVVTVDERGGPRDYPYTSEKRPITEGEVLQGQDLDGVTVIEIVEQAGVGRPGEARGERFEGGLRRPMP